MSTSDYHLERGAPSNSGWRQLGNVVAVAIITGLIQFVITQANLAAERAWWHDYAQGVNIQAEARKHQ